MPAAETRPPVKTETPESVRPPTASAPPRPPLVPGTKLHNGSGFSPRPELPPRSRTGSDAGGNPPPSRPAAPPERTRRREPQSSRRPPTQSVQTARARAQQRRRAASSSPGRRAHSTSPRGGDGAYFPGAKRIGDDDHVSYSTQFLLVAGTTIAVLSAVFVLRAVFSSSGPSSSGSTSSGKHVKGGAVGVKPRASLSRGGAPKVGVKAPPPKSAADTTADYLARAAAIRDAIIKNMKGAGS
ncbi:proline-rich protein [Angomonas deanei]|nr:proline-rich protein [Angomonas deanei]|eukprot:EPY23797.1 proline-rich protein [Angomonas deanei]